MERDDIGPMAHRGAPAAPLVVALAFAMAPWCLTAGCASWARAHFAHPTEGRDLEEVVAITDEVGALAGAGRADELAALVDGEAHKALLVLCAEQTYERSPRVRQTVDLVEDFAFLAVAASVMTRQAVLSAEDIRRGLDWAARQITAAVQEEWKTSLSPGSLLEGAAAGLGATPAERSRALADSLIAAQPARCHFERSIASYRLWLLAHRDWGKAESSRTFQSWKSKVDRGALSVADCDGAKLVLLLTANHGARLRPAAWRLFSAAEWPSVQPRLDDLAHLGRERAR
jgi:hypothetical protein